MGFLQHPTIDAGMVRRYESIFVEERELQKMSDEELRLFERMLREPPTDATFEAYQDGLGRVQIVILPIIPCITTLPK